MTEVIKIEQSTDYVYKYTALSKTPISFEGLDCRPDVSCPVCLLEGQFWWQSNDKTRLEFYCPKCNTTWSVFVERIKYVP